MAWKMTKKGEIPDYKIWTGKCSYCNAEFECQRSDITNYESSQMDGAWSWEDCSFCDKENTVCMHEKNK